MQTLSQLHDDSAPLEEEERRHGRRLVVGILCALLLTGGIFGGYMLLRKRHEQRLAAAAEAAKVKALTPLLEIFVDEPTMDGKKSLLGGTLHNISSDTLHSLAIELELRKRVGGGLETRIVTPEQAELAPDAKAHYSLELLASDYITSRLVRITTGDNHAAVPFKARQGTPRPPMPAPSGKTVIVGRPAPRGDEFINTPNNPGRVP